MKCVVGSHKRVRGNGWRIVGSHCEVTGNDNVITGAFALVIGNDNTVQGDHAIVHGHYNKGKGNDAKVYGNANAWCGHRCTLRGIDNTLEEPAEPPPPLKKKRARSPSPPAYIEGPPETDLEYDCEAGDDDASCVICLCNTPVCVVLPCLHECMCVQCARRMCFGVGDGLHLVGAVKCPKCRAEVTAIRRTHKE